eukprot:RCo009395
MPISEFASGQWYRWTGGHRRPSCWNVSGRMDFLLDGKPHRVRRGHGHHASFFDSTEYEWAFAGQLDKFEQVSETQEALPWACPLCTLVNSADGLRCVACGFAREQLLAVPAVVVPQSSPDNVRSPVINAVMEKNLTMEKLPAASKEEGVSELLSPEQIALLPTPDLEAHIGRLKDALRAAEEQLKTRTTCVVCLERPRRTVFLPCRHRVSCEMCSAAMGECPMCRSPIAENFTPFE